MDLPQPPADIEHKNIIDKLANFVARNGPEFEQMTKNKQKGNPKFNFLFGGELYNYYQYKVTTEQAILKMKAASSSPAVGGQNMPPLPPGCGPYSDTATTTASSMTPLQIMNAAANSTQWHMQQQQQPPPPAINNTAVSLASLIEQQNVLQQQITQSEQNLAAQHAALIQSEDTLIEDAIRKFQIERHNQKAIETGIDLNEFDSILQPIIDSCTKDSISSGKAWILGHTSRGSHDVIAEHLLFKVITPGVPFTQKLHVIYLVNDVMHHCVRKNASILKQALENVVVPMFCNSWIVASNEQQGKLSKLLNLWEAKSTYFSNEVITKMKSADTSWKNYKEDLVQAHEDIYNAAKMTTKTTFQGYRAQHDVFVNHAISQIQTLEAEKIQLERQRQEQDHLLQLQSMQNLPEEMRPMSFATPPPNVLPPGGFIPPPDFSHLPPELLPDFSRPPPGFQPEPEEVIPTVPYYELPAGLMVTLVKIDDFGYKPLDPNKLRLPPAIPPSERLVQALEAFYQKTYTGNSRERLILDADGWEKLGLYEYYKGKNAARKKKEQDIESGLRDRSRSPSPIRRERSRSKSPRKKRVYRSKSPSPRRKSRSRSKSPQRRSNGKKSPRRSRSSRRSRSRSRSESPPQRPRSPSPPSFLGGYAKTPEEKLDESNKGHQMLKKMGWAGTGSGLGFKGQGRAEPISGGDVRDKQDQYKGVGVNLHDPFESFRKNKGQAFITRMKARAEERAAGDPE